MYILSGMFIILTKDTVSQFLVQQYFPLLPLYLPSEQICCKWLSCPPCERQ